MNSENESPVLYVVHCVDTEGPLDESLGATFGRLQQIYGINVEPSHENLTLLQEQRFPGVDGELACSIAATFAPDLLAFNRSWEEISAMNELVFSDQFRNENCDSFGQPWKISWFCMDHIGLETNPRRKSLGFGTIHRYYSKLLERFREFDDELQFHFHPRSIGNNDVAAATDYSTNLPEIIESLTRRLLEFNWFPTCYRPGFHSIRPDSNLFLEQWFPFDYANQFHETEDDQPDLSSGRFGDWRNAPSTWRGYHPSLTDYQAPGNLRRTTFRCLNLGTRTRLLGKNHVHQAFKEALTTGGAVLSFTNHDFRDITSDIDQARAWLAEVSSEYPSVKIRFATASEAARKLMQLTAEPPRMSVAITGSELSVEINREEVFSHQPFLAIQLKDGNALHDNFDRGLGAGSFSYIFDELTVPLEDIEKIGVAVTGLNGISASQVFTPALGRSGSSSEGGPSHSA